MRLLLERNSKLGFSILRKFPHCAVITTPQPLISHAASSVKTSCATNKHSWPTGLHATSGSSLQVHRGIGEKNGRLAVEAKGVGKELGHRALTVWASITSPLVFGPSRPTDPYVFVHLLIPCAHCFSGQLLVLPPLHLLLSKLISAPTP